MMTLWGFCVLMFWLPYALLAGAWREWTAAFERLWK